MSEPCSTAMIAIRGGALSHTQIAALDVKNLDGKVAKEEATTPVLKRLADGQVPKNLGEPSAHGGMRCVAGMFRV